MSLKCILVSLKSGCKYLGVEGNLEFATNGDEVKQRLSKRASVNASAGAMQCAAVTPHQ